jgi:mono/diheme cytochrome c family protein
MRRSPDEPRSRTGTVLVALSVVALTFAITFATGALGSSGGISGHSGDPNVSAGASCASCHVGGTAPNVTLTGPTDVTVGTQSTYTLTITGGQAAGGGLGVSTTAGTLVAVASDTRLLAGQIVQRSTKPVDGSGAVSWTFDWTAPASPGTAALYASGNSVDLDGGPGGDASTEVSLSITVNPIPNIAPVAVVGGPYSGVMREGITFDATGSSDADGTITSYRWDFGDGSPVADFGTAGLHLQHSYATAGTYTVTLTVVDDTGATTSASVTAAVTEGTPPPPTVPPSTTTTTTTTTTTPPTTTAPVTTTVPANGRTVYNASCANCHGPSGQGGIGPSLVASTLSASAINTVTANGSGAMPGFATILSPAELRAVVALTASMQSSTAPPTTTTTLPPAATGADIYSSSCAGCHGAQGQGGVGPSLIDAPAAVVVIRAITANGAGTMPGFADQLTDSQIDLISAYVASLAPSTPADDPGTEDDDDDDESDSSVITDPGQSLYVANCASCHGADGTGGSASELDRFYESDDLISLINRGPGDMPPFAELLSEAEIQLIADHVSRFADATPAVAGTSNGNASVAPVAPAAPPAPSSQSRDLIDRLAQVPGTAGADDRAGFPTLLALGMALGAIIVTGGLIRRVGHTTPQPGDGQEGQSQ